MTKQEIQKLMRVRGEAEAEKRCGSLANKVEPSIFMDGVMYSTDTLAECLSLALEGLEYFKGSEFNFIADNAIEAIESKLKEAE